MPASWSCESLVIKRSLQTGPVSKPEGRESRFASLLSAGDRITSESIPSFPSSPVQLSLPLVRKGPCDQGRSRGPRRVSEELYVRMGPGLPPPATNEHQIVLSTYLPELFWGLEIMQETLGYKGWKFCFLIPLPFLMKPLLKSAYHSSAEASKQPPFHGGRGLCGSWWCGAKALRNGRLGSGLVFRNCDLQGPPWSQSRCKQDRHRL